MTKPHNMTQDATNPPVHTGPRGEAGSSAGAPLHHAPAVPQPTPAALDYDEIERLATEAAAISGVTEWSTIIYGPWLCREQIEFLVACSPDVVLALVAVARSAHPGTTA